MSGRLNCCVPFCRRTIAREKLPIEHTEWICAKHWPLVPKGLKRRKRLSERAEDRARSQIYVQVGDLVCYDPKRLARYTAIAKLSAAIWERCKGAAIEAAAGI